MAQDLICPPVEVVFAMDTSGSMNDEAAALCSSISTVESDLAAAGVSATAFLYGIEEDGEEAGTDFSCLTDSVANAVGTSVPGNNGTCGTTLSDSESWGEAITILADGFSWTSGAVRIVVPISDEGACDGNSCQDPGEDRDAIANAITFAQANNVFVSPLAGTGAGSCVNTLGQDVANATGGEWFASTDPELDLASAIRDLILSACKASNNPPQAKCKDIIVPAGNDCSAEASVDDGSFDPEEGAVILTQQPAGPYGVGTTEVELTVLDNGGLQSTCKATVTVTEERTDGGTCGSDVACTRSDNSSVLFALDGNARSLRSLTRRLANAARKQGVSGNAVKNLEQQANDAYLNTWSAVWGYPRETISCQSSPACAVAPTTDSISDTAEQFKSGRAVAVKLARLLKRKLEVARLPKRAKRRLKRIKKLVKRSLRELGGLPTQQSVCDATQINILFE